MFLIPILTFDTISLLSSACNRKKDLDRQDISTSDNLRYLNHSLTIAINVLDDYENPERIKKCDGQKNQEMSMDGVAPIRAYLHPTEQQ